MLDFVYTAKNLGRSFPEDILHEVIKMFAKDIQKSLVPDNLVQYGLLQILHVLCIGQVDKYLLFV